MTRLAAPERNSLAPKDQAIWDRIAASRDILMQLQRVAEMPENRTYQPPQGAPPK